MAEHFHHFGRYPSPALFVAFLLARRFLHVSKGALQSHLGFIAYSQVVASSSTPAAAPAAAPLAPVAPLRPLKEKTAPKATPLYM